MKIPGVLLSQEVDLEPFLGSTGKGPSFAAPRKLPVQLEERRRLIQGGNQGDRISEATIRTNPDEDIALGSRITLADGRRLIAAQVIKPRVLAGQVMTEVLLTS